MYLCKSHLLRTRWNEEMLSKNMFVGLFSITVFQQTHLLQHALCTNPYISFQIVKGMVSLQNALQCFHWSWKQESWALPERDVSFYNTAFSPFTLFLSMSIRLQVEVRLQVCLGKNDTRLPRESFFSSSFCSRIWKRVQEKSQIRIRVT